ncbi:unnamed protein product [Schistosoma mattheei]|uniref:Uncharacterized protein n=1 Tax=Schistosoma mattheei TaxID=31246 RepID=A0A3P7YG96_9TREM|nr:unnamed protein product [Schistosoma mattheei]
MNTADSLPPCHLDVDNEVPSPEGKEESTIVRRPLVI